MAPEQRRLAVAAWLLGLVSAQCGSELLPAPWTWKARPGRGDNARQVGLQNRLVSLLAFASLVYQERSKQEADLVDIPYSHSESLRDLPCT